MTRTAVVRTLVACVLSFTAVHAAIAQPGLPGPPTNFQIGVSGNVLSLSWGPPATGAAPTNYTIIARNTAGGLITTQNAFPTPSFVGAVPNGVYVLSVRASNAVGAGPETAAQTVTVPASPGGGPNAPGVPTNLQVNVTGSVVSISWGLPASGGAPTNYELIARGTTGNVLFRQNVWPTPSLEASAPNGTYVISVRASNANGFGPETIPVTTTVPANQPGAPGTPVNLQASMSGNTLSVSWGPPTTGGTPTNYRLIARNQVGATLATTNAWPTPSFVGNVPNGVYVITVQAINATGAGPETPPVTITAPSAAQIPGAPRNLSATASGDVVTFGWTPPVNNTAAPVSSYVLRASTTPGGAPIATLTVGGTVTQTSVPGVPAGTYYASVVAVNPAGTSPASNTATVVVGGGSPGTSRSTLNPPGVPSSIEARDSQIASDGALPVKGFDDFAFANGSTIRQVGWQGIYCVEQNNAAAPSPTASGFVISIHPDQGGRPNTTVVLASANVSLAQANQTSNGVYVNATCGSAANTRWALYSYSTVLPAAFTAAPGVRYWFSVQALTPSFSVHWGWRSGTTDTRSSHFLYNGSLIPFSIDRAFSLAP